MKYKATKAAVANRGSPPDSFLDELVEFGKKAPPALFQSSPRRDIYLAVAPILGPWRGTSHRKCVMLEVLRVLAGFESSWNWQEGVDTTNPDSCTPLTEETGIFQVSADSMSIDPSLRTYVRAMVGSTAPDAFIQAMKENKQLAISYCARLLRFTTNHHGPIKRGDINQWLSQDAVREFEKLIG